MAVQISISRVTNGIIKTVIDDNINGTESVMEETMVYDTKRTPENTILFLKDLASDLGLSLNRLTITLNEPTKLQRVKSIESVIKKPKDKPKE